MDNATNQQLGIFAVAVVAGLLCAMFALDAQERLQAASTCVFTRVVAE